MVTDTGWLCNCEVKWAVELEAACAENDILQLSGGEI